MILWVRKTKEVACRVEERASWLQKKKKKKGRLCKVTHRSRRVGPSSVAMAKDFGMFLERGGYKGVDMKYSDRISKG